MHRHPTHVQHTTQYGYPLKGVKIQRKEGFPPIFFAVKIQITILAISLKSRAGKNDILYFMWSLEARNIRFFNVSLAISENDMHV